jgi:hypothetical protein
LAPLPTFAVLSAFVTFAPLAVAVSLSAAAEVDVDVDIDVDIDVDAASAADDAPRAAFAVGKDGAATDAAPYRVPSAALSERHNETTGFMNRSACWT